MAKRGGSYIGGSTTLSTRDTDWFLPEKRPPKKIAKKKPSLGLVGRAFERAKTSDPPQIYRKRKK
jgi:hypothetical protein